MAAADQKDSVFSDVASLERWMVQECCVDALKASDYAKTLFSLDFKSANAFVSEANCRDRLKQAGIAEVDINRLTNRAQGWGNMSLRQVCECEVCQQLGPQSTHNAESHDQSLDQKLVFKGRTLRLIGGTTKCARVFLEYLESHGSDVDGQSLVEVGSGTGLVGMCCALSGASVCLTDQEPMLETLQYNVDLNLEEAVKARISVRALQWGSSLDEFPGSYDVVIGSDLIFAKENIPPLVATFNEFRKKNPNTIVYLASITRFRWEASFFELMQQTFKQEKVLTKEDIEIFRFTPLAAAS